MNASKHLFAFFFFISNLVFAGTFELSAGSDSLKSTMVYSGSIGVTTNGFSIIPSFSLNSPAIVSVLTWRKNKFSISPDIRLTPGLSKGGMLLWFRYFPVQRKHFVLRVGTHPALNFQFRDIVTNGKSSTITQMRRFLAWEVSPTFTLSNNWTVGVYYLQGNGLQLDGPRTTHFVTLNTSLSKIRISPLLRFSLIGAVYYLNLDGYEGQYLTATAILSNLKFPVSLESSINQTFKANLPGNRQFMWNVTLNYNFRKVYRRVDILN